MGTRHLISVINTKGETKIAQYGQWDGYLSGHGISILRFLKEKDLNKFDECLNKCRFWDSKGRDKDFIESYDKNAPVWFNDPDNRTEEQKRWFNTYVSGDLGSEILNNVFENAENEKEILLQDNSDFIKDTLFCKYAYTIDLQKRELRIDTMDIAISFDELPTEEDFIKLDEEE